MKEIIIDWKQFEAYCAMQCTLREIADYFNCSEKTIERKVKEHYDCLFVDAFKRKRQVGLMSLRRNMFNLATKHPSMAIFLAKNWLGMKDVQEITGAGGTPLAVKITVFDKETKEITERLMDGEAPAVKTY